MSHNGCSSDLRVVLVGQERVGKSSAGNTILGRKEFDCSFSSSPVTLSCVERAGEVGGRRVSVVDTPGLSSSVLTQDQVKAELQEALRLSSPGPHVFLLTIQLGRFTEQEQKSLEVLENMLSPDVSKHTMVLFTHGDRLEEDDINPDQFISKDKNLQKLLKKCSDRYQVFNNRRMEDRDQVQQLLDQIESVSDGGRRVYEERHESTEGEAGDGGGVDLRVVLVGQERVGKSSAGNTILGRNEFQSQFSASPATLRCEKREVMAGRHRVSVVDTPGLFSSELTQDQVKAELEEALKLSSPGPHVFLLTIQLGRFTEQEQKGLEILENMLSPDVSEHTMVLFTHGDKLEEENKDLDQFISEDENLQKLLKKCSGLYQGFNNRRMEDRDQVQQLLDKIDAVSEGGRRVYEKKISWVVCLMIRAKNKMIRAKNIIYQGCRWTFNRISYKKLAILVLGLGLGLVILNRKSSVASGDTPELEEWKINTSVGI